MEQVVRTDTDTVMYDTNEHYDLIFTPAGSIVDPENVVKTEDCECGDCNDCNDWVSGDIVNW
jgi:hypothetical protein